MLLLDPAPKVAPRSQFYLVALSARNFGSDKRAIAHPELDKKENMNYLIKCRRFFNSDVGKKSFNVWLLS